jgi:hypothetical protein
MTRSLKFSDDEIHFVLQLLELLVDKFPAYDVSRFKASEDPVLHSRLSKASSSQQMGLDTFVITAAVCDAMSRAGSFVRTSAQGFTSCKQKARVLKFIKDLFFLLKDDEINAVCPHNTMQLTADSI